jgi:hypothetical protein
MVLLTFKAKPLRVRAENAQAYRTSVVDPRADQHVEDVAAHVCCLHSSWPGLSRPSTSSFLAPLKSWMPGTRLGMTNVSLVDGVRGLYRSDSAMPLTSRLTISPVWLPLRCSTAPFWLVRTIACGPRMMVAPAPAAP